MPRLGEEPPQETYHDATPPADPGHPRTTLQTLIDRAYANLAREDPVHVVMNQLREGERISKITSLSDCSVQDKKLYFQGRLWIPDDQDLRDRCLSDIHRQPMSGHPGRARSYELAQREFYWPKMLESVRKFVKACSICA